MDLTERTITLSSGRGDQGSHYLSARCTAEGDVVIEGQALGKAVKATFGMEGAEYEWFWTIPSREVDKLCQALGGGDDVLTLLYKRFSGDRSSELGDFFKAEGISASFWSRVGD